MYVHINALQSKPSMNLTQNYTFKSPYSQQFSFDYPLIQYLLKHPHTWIKLIKTCKYFFSKNPFYPVASVKSVNDSKWILDGDLFFNFNTTATKLWVHEKLEVLLIPMHPNNLIDSNKISSLIPKMFKCELQNLEICYQKLTFGEYQFLTSSGTLLNVKLVHNTILYSDGTPVTVDKLLENFKKLETFEMSFLEHPAMFKPDTVKNIAKILPTFQQLDLFELNGLRQSFNFSSFTDFLMKNDTVRVCLKFYGPLSGGYKQIIYEFIDAIIANHPKRIPDLVFDGFGGDRAEKYTQLYERQYRFNDFSDR